MWGAGPDPAVVGCMAQAAVELSPCGKGHPFGEEGTANPQSRELPSRMQIAGQHLGAEHRHGEVTQRGKQGH